MRQGLILAAGSYLLWGLFPLYFHLLEGIPPIQVLMHRMLWSLLFLVLVLTFRRQWAWLPALRREPATILRFVASATLLSVNWFIYIWAVNRGHVIDASLGYFMNPLVNILLGAVLLGERLRPGQWLSVAAAALGVLLLTLQAHAFPWISLALGFSFGLYGLLRKTASLGALEGLSLETLLLAPLAIAYLAVLTAQGNDAFLRAPSSVQAWLMAAGPITAIPLLMFAAGARRIPLSALGLLQYIAPSMQLMLGVVLFHESFGGARLAGFACIWGGLLIYSAEGLLRVWQTRPSAATSSA